MRTFWLSLGLVFLAELGDKTQLVALLLATRFKTGVVLAGISALKVTDLIATQKNTV